MTAIFERVWGEATSTIVEPLGAARHKAVTIHNAPHEPLTALRGGSCAIRLESDGDRERGQTGGAERVAM